GIMIALYYRIAEFDRSVPFAIVALLLAGASAWTVEILDRRPRRPGLPSAAAIFAAGAIAALALPLTFSLEQGWLSVGLALMLLVCLEIRHVMNDGDVYRRTGGLGEVALQVSSALAMAIGLERVRARTGSIVHDAGALVVAALALAGIVLGLWLIDNPLLTSR